MGNSFDEVELVHIDDLPAVASPLETALPRTIPERETDSVPAPRSPELSVPADRPAPRLNRILALSTDLSLFVAIGLALSPLIEIRATLADTLRHEPSGILALGAFLLLLSFYYFPLCWMIWGRTVGAALFDLRVVSDHSSAITAPQAARRWTATLLSLGSALLGFVPGLFPTRRTLADRVSASRVVRSL